MGPERLIVDTSDLHQCTINDPLVNTIYFDPRPKGSSTKYYINNVLVYFLEDSNIQYSIIIGGFFSVISVHFDKKEH